MDQYQQMEGYQDFGERREKNFDKLIDSNVMISSKGLDEERRICISIECTQGKVGIVFESWAIPIFVSENEKNFNIRNRPPC
ncbi:hypothetical protein MKW92_013285 [Papaver armeniacum]|nr:hypothetical protein MKW92_013285 [Papaver armeniacum]